MIDNLIPEAKRLELTSLAQTALDALLTQSLVTLIHAADWERDGFPLPHKRMKPDVDGTITQDYRPLALLEYVDEYLRGAIIGKGARDRAAAAKDEAL